MSFFVRFLPATFLSVAGTLVFSSGSLQAARNSKQQTAAAPAAPAPLAKPGKKNPLIADEEIPPVAPTGPLNLQQLIDLALFNNMDVVEARNKIAVAQAKRKAATDWRDPEIRLSYSEQTDIELGDPFTERAISQTYTSGSEYDRESSLGSGSAAGRFRIDTERTTFRESRFRTIERRVIPGATRDKIVESEYETRETRTRGSNSRVERNLGLTDIEGNRTNRYNNRKLLSRTTTYETHRDVTEPESEWGLLLRFPFPNPFEVKALIQEAEAETREADYETKAIENEIILEVRAAYEELCYYESSKQTYEKLASHQQKFTEFARLGAPDKLAGAAGNSSNSRLGSYEAAAKANAARLKLARLVGLNDLNRIQVDPRFRQRILDLSKLDEAYLIQMASVYRADLHLLHAKFDVAQAQYKNGAGQTGSGRNLFRFWV
jgi:outer membrane protein TolC